MVARLGTAATGHIMILLTGSDGHGMASLIIIASLPRWWLSAVSRPLACSARVLRADNP
jgi:hypothetical protein